MSARLLPRAALPKIGAAVTSLLQARGPRALEETDLAALELDLHAHGLTQAEAETVVVLLCALEEPTPQALLRACGDFSQ